ncbi:MAG: RNA polymerase sigma factor [Acidimicrobiales bacterium]
MEEKVWTDAEDRALIARISRGDRSALDTLYRVHAGWLTARLQRRCSQPELVDSAIQDTFVAVWKGAKRYKRKGEVGAWIWGIAVRRLIDLTRKRRPTPMDLLPGRESTSVSAEQQLMDGGIGGDLAAAFAELPPELQAVLVATAIDGLTTKEAGDLLGIPQGTVKTRLMRARDRMRENLT